MKRNRYIFLIPSICNIGGAQLYLAEKIRYLKEKDWMIDVIYARKDVIRIKELEEYSVNCFSFLDYSIMYFRKSYAEKRINKIISSLHTGQDENIVLESCTVSISTWGERIAEKLKCKHICFAFEELFEMSKTQLKFTYFKYLRHELAGIRPESVPLMFKDTKYTIQKPEYYTAYGLSPIENIKDERIELLNDYDIVIGSFGRLDKGFVWDALLEIKKYFISHTGRKYAVLLIGDTKDLIFKNKIYKLFNEIADVIITGELCPVSLELIKKVNVFVSSAGASVLTAAYGIPTIAISPETFLPNGILDYTTKDCLMSKNPSDKSTSELIEDIIDYQICKKLPSLGIYENFYEGRRSRAWKEFDRQMNIALDSTYHKEYYNVYQISLDGKRYIGGLYCKSFGFKIFSKTIKFIKKYYGTIIKG